MPSAKSLILLWLITGLGIGLIASSACGRTSTSDADALLEANDELMSRPSVEIAVVYPAGDTLVQKSVVLDSDRNVELEAMRALFRGTPEGADFRATVPTATVNSVDIEDGHAVVDFSPDVLAEGATAQMQRTALLAVLYTLSPFGVEEVSFSVEGRTSGKAQGKDIETFWGDVNLRQMPWSVDATAVPES